MKTIIMTIAAALCVAAGAAAQTTTVTNGDQILTVSNGNVVATSTLTPSPPPLVSTNGQVVPQAFVDALADATGIPESVLREVPLKYLFWLFVIAVGGPAAAKYLRKLIPDRMQTGQLGAALKHVALEKTPTPASQPVAPAPSAPAAPAAPAPTLPK